MCIFLKVQSIPYEENDQKRRVEKVKLKRRSTYVRWSVRIRVSCANPWFGSCSSTLSALICFLTKLENLPSYLFLVGCIVPKQMAAKRQAASAVKKGMSIRAAADKFGIHPSTLSGHLDIIKRLQGCTTEEKERLVMCAVQAVTVGRLTTRRAARVYGVPEATLRRRVKNPNLRHSRPTLLKSIPPTLDDRLFRSCFVHTCSFIPKTSTKYGACIWICFAVLIDNSLGPFALHPQKPMLNALADILNWLLRDLIAPPSQHELASNQLPKTKTTFNAFKNWTSKSNTALNLTSRLIYELYELLAVCRCFEFDGWWESGISKSIYSDKTISL